MCCIASSGNAKLARNFCGSAAFLLQAMQGSNFAAQQLKIKLVFTLCYL